MHSSWISGFHRLKCLAYRISTKNQKDKPQEQNPISIVVQRGKTDMSPIFFWFCACFIPYNVSKRDNWIHNSNKFEVNGAPLDLLSNLLLLYISSLNNNLKASITSALSESKRWISLRLKVSTCITNWHLPSACACKRWYLVQVWQNFQGFSIDTAFILDSSFFNW